MRIVVCAVVAMALGAAGCKKDPAAAPAAGSASESATRTSEPPVAKPGVRPTCDTAPITPACGIEIMTYFADLACACTAPDCAKSARTEFDTWMKGAKDHVAPDLEPTPTQNHQLDQIMARLGKCTTVGEDTETPTPTEQPETGSGSGSGA